MSDITPSVSPEPEWAAFVAIDWADKKHCWKLLAAGSVTPEEGTLANTPEALSMWAANLQERFAGRPIAVCLEQSRGPLVYALCKFPHLVLYPVHSTTAARYRQAFFPSGSKDDPVDTTLLLELLTRHRDRLRRLNPETPETRLLQMLVEQRRKLVDERTRYSNQLTAWLKMYFPQVLIWIDNIDSPLGCDLLERWPSLEQLKCVNPAKLHDFFTTHNSRSEQRIQERINAIYQAVPAVNDPALLQAGPASVQALVRILQVLNSAIADFDQRIESAANNHPEAPLFVGLPGAGPVLWPSPAATLDRRLRHPTRALPGRRRTAELLRYCSCDQAQRRHPIDPLPQGLPQVSAANFSRVRRTLHPEIHLGSRLLSQPA